MTDDDRFSDAGRKGGEARAAALSEDERKEIAKKGAAARWSKAAAVTDVDEPIEHEPEEVLEPAEDMPIARWRGTLNIVGLEVPCYVLDNGQKIIGRTSVTELLTGIRGGGALEKYIGVKALEPFINKDLVLERLVPFRLLEV